MFWKYQINLKCNQEIKLLLFIMVVYIEFYIYILQLAPYSPFYFLVIHIGSSDQYVEEPNINSIHLRYHGWTSIRPDRAFLYRWCSRHQQTYATLNFKSHLEVISSLIFFWFSILFYAIPLSFPVHWQLRYYFPNGNSP
jgi:hypothetical protein